MRPGIDLRKGMRNDAVFVNDVSDTAGIARIPRTIGLTQDMIRITEQRIGKAEFISKRLVCFYRIKAYPKNLDMVLRKRIVVVTEPVPFGRSTTSVGFRIKPQYHLFATQI
jgi:hypothetical protein